MGPDRSAFWSISPEELQRQLHTTASGLTEPEAERRLKLYGPNTFKAKKKSSASLLLVAQFKSPIILLLLSSAVLSFFLNQGVQALIILIILFISGMLGFWQEYTANDAVSRLLEMVQIKAAVLRDGKQEEIPVEEIVPGDVALLKAGDVVPGDSLILDSKDLFVNEATLTGETYPAEKMAGAVPHGAAPNKRTNSIFMGTGRSPGARPRPCARTRAEELGAKNCRKL